MTRIPSAYPHDSGQRQDKRGFNEDDFVIEGPTVEDMKNFVSNVQGCTTQFSMNMYGDQTQGEIEQPSYADVKRFKIGKPLSSGLL